MAQADYSVDKNAAGSTSHVVACRVSICELHFEYYAGIMIRDTSRNVSEKLVLRMFCGTVAGLAKFRTRSFDKHLESLKYALSDQ